MPRGARRRQRWWCRRRLWRPGWWPTQRPARRGRAAALHKWRAPAREPIAPSPGQARWRLRPLCRKPRFADRPCARARRQAGRSIHRRHRPRDPASASVLARGGGEQVGRGWSRESFEDLAQVVELLGHASRLLDDVCKRHYLDFSVSADRDHPALAVCDQLRGAHSQARRPYPVGRSRRAAPLQMTEHSHACLESGFPLDPSRESIANASLGELHMAECIFFLAGSSLFFELGYVSALRNDDDAEELAVTSAAGEGADHPLESELELRAYDEVGAARQAS